MLTRKDALTIIVTNLGTSPVYRRGCLSIHCIQRYRGGEECLPTHSILKVCPGFTVVTAGISGCQRLCKPYSMEFRKRKKSKKVQRRVLSAGQPAFILRLHAHSKTIGQLPDAWLNTNTTYKKGSTYPTTTVSVQ